MTLSPRFWLSHLWEDTLCVCGLLITHNSKHAQLLLDKLRKPRIECDYYEMIFAAENILHSSKFVIMFHKVAVFSGAVN